MNEQYPSHELIASNEEPLKLISVSDAKCILPNIAIGSKL